MTVILETKLLSKRFGGLLAVNRVSLRVEEGEIFGVIGPNGAGKTTLLNCIAGVYPPSEGRVFVLGRETTGFRPHAMCHLGVARTFQIAHPFPRFTALENVLVAATFGPGRPPAHPAHYAEELLAFVEFPLPKETPAHTLNTVQLKRLDLARALASRPRLLLLDELAAGLTTGELGDLMAIIRKIRQGGAPLTGSVTVIIVEHIMKVIMGLCDRLAVLHYGSKITEGSPQEVVEDARVAEAYLGEKYEL